ncbi:2-isopropylmalate synthase [Methanocella arvoryzae MRE50]|uniref:Probable 2-isopropylmalate synthase n=1 Tax=Methanocella arvoryzae (strain DSM 22066 / NBRC 105507 / MRE50) TaxID=351160 RepID=Q0W6C5_METAR|nr:2-isopropylmalate synthase [Methanocella arvoryzae MRE50]
MSFTQDKKLEIARALDRLGVQVIEAGFPISSAGDKASVKEIAGLGLNATVCGLARVIKADIDACIDADVSMVHTFVSTSDIQRINTIKKSREEVIDISVEMVEYIKRHGQKCLFSAMDATRTDVDYLLQVYKAVEDAGADAINVPDTVGVAAPPAMRWLVGEISKTVKIPIAVHCHNDFGLAVANSLAAVEGGASQIQVTLNSLGERAGNADMAQTVMSLEAIYGVKTGIDTKHLVETARLAERFSGVPLAPTFPVVGANAFSHESGIHSHGVIKESKTFEPGIMTPEMVGHMRRLVLGKHTGKHAVKKLLNDAGLDPSDDELNQILERVKDLGDKGKKVTDVDLYAITEAVMGDVAAAEKRIVLEELSVMCGNKVTPTATVRVTVDGKSYTGAMTGIGPVDAAMKAVERMVDGNGMRLRDFRIEAITGGSDAMAEVMVGVEDGKGRMVTARAAREDIVQASVEALISAMNRLAARPGNG